MKSADEKEKLYLSLQRLTENTIEDIVNRSVNHKNMNNHNDLNINNKYKVLFVCLGNICRSPAAHGVMEDVVAVNNLTDRVEIDSAGTYGGHAGELPDPRMRSAASRRGYNLTHRSRKFREEDFYEFDKIIVMDDSNYENVSRLAPERAYLNKVFRFVEFCTHHPEWTYVPDPYYEGREGFELVLDLLEDGCEGLMEQIKKEL